MENQGKSPKISSAQNVKVKNPTILVIQTHNKNQPTHPSLEINNEHWTEWDIITFHKGIHLSVKNARTEFQHKNILEWSVTNQNGVFGSLVNDMENIFKIIMGRPLFKSSQYFSIGLQHTPSIQVA